MSGEARSDLHSTPALPASVAGSVLVRALETSNTSSLLCCCPVSIELPSERGEPRRGSLPSPLDEISAKVFGVSSDTPNGSGIVVLLEIAVCSVVV